MNEYYGQNGNLVSFPQIKASFVSKINRNECKPEASFSLVFAVAEQGFELDKEGIETDKYCIKGIVGQYGNKADIIPFKIYNEGVINAVSTYWEKGDTVKAMGKLNFSSETTTELIEVDFGEPQERTRTINVSELVITGGSQTPFEGDFALETEEIQAGLKERSARLSAAKEEAANRPKKATTTASKGDFSVDVGF